MLKKLIDVPHRAVAGIAALLVLAAALLVTVLSEGSVQQPVSASAPGQRFSAERAISHLERFATEPRPLGSPASDRAKDYLTRQLRSAGFAVEIQHSVGSRSAAGLATFGRVENVVATLPGRDSTGAVVLVAHYDSAAAGPGASDDGAAVAAMVETARTLSEQGRLRNDLVLLFTDGEEDGLLGASAFVREHPLARQGGVVLNWEARGVSGPSLMFETSRGNSELVSLFTDTVPHPRGDSSMVEIYRMLPNNSDFTALSQAGFAGLNSAYVEGASRYHTADDSIANLDRGSLQHVGENMLHLSAAFGDADLPTLASGHDATYFRIFGTMITYSDAVIWPVAILAVLLVATLVLIARRRRLASVPRMLLGAASAVLPLALSALLGQGLWTLLVRLRPGYDAMGGLLHRPLAFQAALATLAGLALLVWYLSLRRRLGPAALAIGAMMWPAALGVVCAASAPGASFLFALTAMSGALGVLLALLPVRFAAWPVVAVTLGTLIPTALLPLLARNAFIGMGLALAGVGTTCLALFGLTLLPIVELLFPSPARGVGRRVALAVPLTAALLAAGLVGAGLAVDRFDVRHPERTHLAYVLNADTGTAAWVSGEDEPTAWTGKHVSSRDISTLPPGYARGRLWTGAAKPMAVAGPEVSVRARDGDTRTVHVESRRAASSLTLRVDHRIVEVTAAIPGAAPVTLAVTGTRANTWPAEIRFRDLPPGGVDITLRTPGADHVRITAVDETSGLADAPGFQPRPLGVVASTREDGDLVAVARTYEI